MTKSAVEVAHALHQALEAGQHGAQLKGLFTEDAFTIEHPNPIRPRGGRSDLQKMLAASEAGAGLLREQRYQVHSALDHGDLAIFRLTWTGVIAKDAGPFRAGQVLTAQIAQFIQVRDGRIASIETYDCYPPFDPPAPA